MRILAIWVGKLVYLALKISKHQGAALPGYIAEVICHSILEKSLQQLPHGVVIVTGTNGKTTSVKMLSHVLSKKYRVINNPTGSNFTRGIASSIVWYSSWTGKLKYDIGVFELDEAYAAKFVDRYSPRAVLVLNVMRDQMDRFGEIDYVAKLIGKVVAKTTEVAVLNRDDKRVAEMSKDASCEVLWFGVDKGLVDIFVNDDEMYYIGRQTTAKAAVKAHSELIKYDNFGNIEIKLHKKIIKLNIKDITSYNALNVTAVVLLAKRLGIDSKEIVSSTSEIKPAFGRGECIKYDKSNIILQLVKNPGGFRQALITGKNISNSATMIAINDDYADGRDVSWLWDVDFVNYLSDKSKKIIVSGDRAADMALRLKYDEIRTYLVEPDLKKGLQALAGVTKVNHTAIIYTTYTAMLHLRAMLYKDLRR
ncbi:DUF1727 domain-containing protein [Candidatus Saccharibacteria bacterium]|jgi:UDP-N-acetylmuramyl tripeptide synthase|nr:DUF1727 domain-containing protein [Candidatus Saccharibacteria bacterium]HOR23520.1 MurT ligase domain-containing protein [Candidatus Saccharibacteria bacterium]